MAVVSATLGIRAQTLHKWGKAEREGKLTGAGMKLVTPDKMALARLRAEVVRLKMERDILKNRACGSPRPLWSKRVCSHVVLG
jgi:transposase